MTVSGRKRHKRFAGSAPTLLGMNDGRIGGNHTVWGLKRKRAEIAGIIADHDRKLKHWRAVLVHIDATLRVFDGEIDPNTIKPKRSHHRTQYLPGAELVRYAMDQLRLADGAPIACKAIVDAAIAAHGIPDRPVTRLSLMDRLGRWLKEKAEAGEIVKHGPTHDAKWSVPPEDEQE